MKKSLFIFLLLCAAFTLAADALDQMSIQLDRIERDFWLSLRAEKGEYRENTSAVLNKFATTASQIQNFLVIKQQKKYGTLASSARQLQQIYIGAKMATVRRFRLNFKPTSFKAYQSEFNRVLKEKAAEEAAASGGNGSQKKRSKKSVIRPGLKTVDLIEYERWLAEITSDNMEKFMKVRNNGNDSEVQKMQDAVNNYLTCLRQLRLVMAKIRQETKFDFK